jgi:hypothetical protein
MVKIHTLVPLSHPTTGEQFAAGTEVDVADDVAADWKADGKIAYSDDVDAAAKAANEGNYSARTGREDVTGKDEPAPKKAKA